MRKTIFLLIAVLIIAGCASQGEQESGPTTTAKQISGRSAAPSVSTPIPSITATPTSPIYTLTKDELPQGLIIQEFKGAASKQSNPSWEQFSVEPFRDAAYGEFTIYKLNSTTEILIPYVHLAIFSSAAAAKEKFDSYGCAGFPGAVAVSIGTGAEARKYKGGIGPFLCFKNNDIFIEISVNNENAGFKVLEDYAIAQNEKINKIRTQLATTTTSTFTTTTSAAPASSIIKFKLLKEVGGNGDVKKFAWSPDSKILYIATGSYAIALDPKTGSKIAINQTASSGRSGDSLSVSSDGKYIVAGGKVFDAKTLSLVKDLDAGSIGSFSSDNTKVATTSPMGTAIRIFDTSTWTKTSELSNLPLGEYEMVSDLQWSKDGKRLYIGKSVIDSSTGSVVKKFENISLYHSGKFTPDGAKFGLATGHPRLDTLSVYDSQTFNSLTEFKPGSLSTWDWSPDGKYVVTNNGEIWNLDGKKVSEDMYGKNILYIQTAWSPDGKMIAFGTRDFISIFEKV